MRKLWLLPIVLFFWLILHEIFVCSHNAHDTSGHLLGAFGWLMFGVAWRFQSRSHEALLVEMDRYLKHLETCRGDENVEVFCPGGKRKCQKPLECPGEKSCLWNASKKPVLVFGGEEAADE